jgi:hypothetical protein
MYIYTQQETFYLAMVAGLMVLRTFCDIWQIRNGC